MVQINDICSSINKKSAHRSIGYISENSQCRYHLYIANDPPGSRKSSKSLEKLLGTPSKERQGSKLPLDERLQIAATLASSVLQLDGTSWLKKDWSCRDIYFHYEEGQNEERQSSKHFQPHVSWKLSSLTSDAYETTDLPASVALFIKNESMVALALTLVELCFGNTLSALETEQDAESNARSIDQRLATAYKLIDDIEMHMGVEYKQVVERCFNFPSSQGDEETQTAILETVVTPLIMQWEQCSGRRYST